MATPSTPAATTASVTTSTHSTLTTDHAHHHHHHNHHPHEHQELSAEEKQWRKEEKLIRRPILSKSDSESQSDSQSSSSHKHDDGQNQHNNESGSSSSSSDYDSSSDEDNHDHQDTHDHHQQHHHHHHGGVPCTGHHDHDHNKEHSSHNHDHHDHHTTSHNQHNHNHDHQHSHAAKPTQITSTTPAATAISALSALVKSDSNSTQFEDQNNLLKDLLKRCFYTAEVDAQTLDASYIELHSFFTDLIDPSSSKSINLPQLLTDSFFKKITTLAQLDHPKRCAKVVALFEILFSSEQVISHILTHLREHQRLVIDISNAYFTLIEKFKHTPLEIKAKMAFTQFQQLLMKQGFKHLLQVLQESKSSDDNQPSTGLTQEQKELFETVQQFARHPALQSKQEAVKYITLLLGKCESVIDQYKIFVYYLPGIFSELSKASFNKEEQQLRNNYVNSVLDIFDRYIFPIEFIVNIDTARVQGSRAYHLNYLHSILLNFTKIYNVAAVFLNAVLLMPEDIQLSLRTLFIIRRLYYLFSADTQIKELLEGPIITVLSNLAVYSKEPIQMKEPTLFLYKLLDDPTTLESLKDKLESSEHVLKLKSNKYFGVRAKSYPQDIDVQYSFNTLNFQISYPVFKTVDAGSLFFHNILVTKPDTIIYWSFKTIEYDIKYGLFKMDTLNPELQIEQYESERSMKAIIKIAKVDSHKDPIMAYSLVNQPGLYRIVFDNTYSYWRAKEVLYAIQILEP